jgi:hypothetical protein
MKFKVYFHYFFDIEDCEYGTEPICYSGQISSGYLEELWTRHPDLTLLAVI